MFPFVVVSGWDQAAALLHSILEHWLDGSGFGTGIDDRLAVRESVAPAHGEGLHILLTAIRKHRYYVGRKNFAGGFHPFRGFLPIDPSRYQLRRLRRGRRIRRLHEDGRDRIPEAACAGAGRRVRPSDPRQPESGAGASGESHTAELRAHRWRQLLCSRPAEYGRGEAGRGAQGYMR